MGRLIYGMSVSLDGFVETPARSLDWVQVDEELHSFFNDQSRAMSASLYGRRMYELMASPSSSAPGLRSSRDWSIGSSCGWSKLGRSAPVSSTFGTRLPVRPDR